VIWGLYHGSLLVVHREFKRMRTSIASLTALLNSAAGKCISVVLTFHAVCIGWVLFRADNMDLAAKILSKMFMLDAIQSHTPVLAMNLQQINYPLIYPSIFILLPLLAIAHIFMGWLDRSGWVARSPMLLKAAWCVVMILLVVVFSPDKSPRFIYFQF